MFKFPNYLKNVLLELMCWNQDPRESDIVYDY